MSEKIDISLSAEDLLQYLEIVNNKIEETEKKAEVVVEQVEKSTDDTYRKVLNMARGAYLTTIGILKAGGMSISYMHRAAISATFSTVAMLEPLLMGRAITTSDWVSYALGMVELSLAVAAAVAAESEQMNIARALRGGDMAMLGVQQLIGSISSW